MVHHSKLKKLQRLHSLSVEGNEARIERDELILELYSAGMTQVDLADLLNQVEPGSVTRNQVQKIVDRRRNGVSYAR